MDAVKHTTTQSAAQRLSCAGYDDTVIFSDYSYDSALIGVTSDGRAVYDFDEMVEWLAFEEGWSEDEAIEWIEFNTIRALFPRRPHSDIQVGLSYR